VGIAAGVRFVGAGTESRGRSAEVALALATTPVDDLRAALARLDFEGEDGVDMVFLAGPGAFGGDASSDAEADRAAIRACRERGVAVMTLEPLPASMLAFARPTAGSPEVRDDEHAERELGAVFAPRLRSSKRCRELTDVLGDFGVPRVVQIESLGRPGEGSLGARLYDALDSVRWLLGDAESAHAAYVPGPGAGRELPTDTLAGLRGTMSVNLQFEDGRAAHVLASDVAATWSRSITLLGDASRVESGTMRVSDEAFQWVGADGGVLDTSKAAKRRPARPGADGPHAVSAEVIGAQVRELLAGRTTREAPIEAARVLAMAGTVLLSARTRQAESVANVLRMMGMGG
jgi:hypothetical protein